MNICIIVLQTEVNTCSEELQQRINACTTVEQLRDLVFSTKDKTEAMDKAFTMRLQELESY
jgi:hypothetical protein